MGRVADPVTAARDLAGFVRCLQEVDTTGALEAWDASLAAEYDGPPRWIHGDLMPGNLLVANGRLRRGPALDGTA